MTTTFPKARPSVNQWFQFIALTNRIKPSDIDESAMIGKFILDGLKSDPLETIKMIQEQYVDNPILMEKVIGTYNTKLICNQSAQY